MSLRLPPTLLLIAATAPLFAADPPAADAAPTNAQLEQRIQELDQQIRILARKAEITTEEAEAKAKTSPKVFASAKEGFGIISADGTYKVRIRALLQADARVFLNDPNNDLTGTAATQTSLTNQFLVRAFRLPIEASLGPVVDAVLIPEFAGNYGATTGNNYRTFVVNEGYIDLKAIPKATLRVGKFVGIVGQDRFQSTSALQFPERSLASNLTADRDVGIQAFGSFSDGAYGYAVALVNGSPDGSAREGEASASGAPSGDAKEGDIALWVDALKTIDKESTSSLVVGLAGSLAHESGTSGNPNLPSYRSPGQQTIFSYVAGTPSAATTARSDGTHVRYDPYFRLYSGAFSLLGEYITTQQGVRVGTHDETLSHQAWYLQTGWVLTGEDASFRGVAPRADFNPSAGTWGAVEVVARVHQITFDEDAFATPAATRIADPSKSVRKANAVGVGANWYWSRNVKLAASYDRTKFEDGAGVSATRTEDRATENVIVSRVQIAF